jgi:uncharacterized membrane protein YebE (DUF533 family)
MFGFGNTRRNSGRQVRNDTFGGSNMRNAALAGVGMLAWRWWKNRQASGSRMQNESTRENRSFSERTTSDRTTQPTDSIYS